MSSDGSGLEKLKEVEDDDDESTNGSAQGAQLQETQAKALEMLARENAILRQQNYHTNLRLRPRSSTTNVSLNSYVPNGPYSVHDSLTEGSDYAIDELDEISELHGISNKGQLGRRFSEYGIGQTPRPSVYMSLENRKLESVKKAYWQSSGFGGLSDIPQSRRHSFADVPTRQGSVSSVGEPLPAHDDQAQESLLPQDHKSRYPDSISYPMNDHGEFLYIFENLSCLPFLLPWGRAMLTRINLSCLIFWQWLTAITNSRTIFAFRLPSTGIFFLQRKRFIWRRPTFLTKSWNLWRATASS
jgi:hypothetical protein